VARAFCVFIYAAPCEHASSRSLSFDQYHRRVERAFDHTRRCVLTRRRVNEKRKTLAPRPKRSPTPNPCVPPLKLRQNVQRARNARTRALIARRRGARFPHCLQIENVYRYKKPATKVRGAGRASISPKNGKAFLGGKTILLSA